MKMSSTRVKSTGWAAFDLKQRQKEGHKPEIDKDPYPPMPSSLTSLRHCENTTRHNNLSMRPFSSVLLPSTFIEKKNPPKHMRACDSDSKGENGNKLIEVNNQDVALKNLRELHSWADNSLTEDILATVDNNIQKASNILEEMVTCCSGSTEENKETKIIESHLKIDDSTCHEETCNFSLRTNLDLSKSSSTTVKDSIKDNCMDKIDAHAPSWKNLSDNAADIKSILERLSSLPIEPEWEEDDVYLVHRKDAMKMMRSASQHSKAANNAFSRGDHFSAQQHSRRARKEWLIAEKLNAQAAKEILSIRNHENDIWKLDFHGLHAMEAVEALQERLQKIEMLMPMNLLVSQNRFKAKNDMAHNSPLESFSSMNVRDMDKQHAAMRQIQLLQIITGVGNHSRGQAALPAAVKSFLSENGYRFEETRPGVIMVQPKFRQR